MGCIIGLTLPLSIQAQTTISGATGTYPTAATLDADANIYTVQYDTGGDHYDVVKYTSTSGYSSSSVIYNGLYYDGEYPTDIEVASNGDVYVADGFDEPASTGAILRLDASNGYSSTSIPLLGSYPTALGIDWNDDIYVSEYDGSSTYQVVKYDVSSGYAGSVIYSGLGNDNIYSRGLTIDPDGNVYVSTDFSVDGANGKILKLTAPDYSISTLDQGDYYVGLAANGIGDLFATAYNAASDNYEIVKYTGGTGTPTSVITGLTYTGSNYPTGLGSNLALGDIVTPDRTWASNNGRLLYLDQPEPFFPPTVSTISASGIGTNSATLSGEVTDDGNASVSEHGIVWSTTSSPDVNDHKISLGSGTGTFSTTQNLFPFGTQIYFRAYATNSEGAAYGSEEMFTTNSEISRDLTGNAGWRLLSVPANVSLSDFLSPIWTQGISTGADADFGNPNVFTWDINSTGHSSAGWQAVDDLTTTLSAGQGVLVYVYEDADYNGPQSPGFPQTLTINSSEHIAPVSPVDMNTNTDGWTLLGNPFSVPVSWDAISRTDLNDAIYVWDPNDDTGDGGQANQSSGSWKTRVNGVGDFDGTIAPFQGFFVQADGSGSPSISFEQDDKTTGSATFLGKSGEPDALVRLELRGHSMTNSTWLKFSNEGSMQKNKGDAFQLEPFSADYALLSTKKEDGSLLDIGHYPTGHNQINIPLTASASKSGEYSLTPTNWSLPDDMKLFLNDRENQKSILLKKAASYWFSIEAPATKKTQKMAVKNLTSYPDSTERFSLSFQPIYADAVSNEPNKSIPSSFSLQQNYPNPFNPVTEISYKLPNQTNVQLEVFDAMGRSVNVLVHNKTQAAGSHSVTFDASHLSSGVYLYRLKAGDVVLTKKLTLIK
ncbi:T9SS type A sorting domain-containing protein [Gracilimonas mengyeensis]|nr:T9SS type A sorting domain-containing protein [Gracilimonas mengyeensis]